MMSNERPPQEGPTQSENPTQGEPLQNERFRTLPGYMRWLLGGLLSVLILCALGISTYASVLAKVVWTTEELGSAGDGLVSVVAAIFGVLITGVFIFMTFRIDRGAMLEAHMTAKEEAKKAVERADNAVKCAKKVLNDATNSAKKAAKEAAEEGVNKAFEEHKKGILEEAKEEAKMLMETAKSDAESKARKLISNAKVVGGGKIGLES